MTKGSWANKRVAYGVWQVDC